ncbi:Nucleoside-diphosphate-sugar epimerase [Pseudomonas sp. ok272]|nr:Nucleoside-diphosphate-sugar epimerase [Pseudomonas sp. ok272]SFM89863.1 Nucleoside-diphosphate-sugar epimerase [Pseudomonas sp. ok602]
MPLFPQESAILLNDLEAIAHEKSVPWAMLRDKTVLVTGATGLMGGLLVKAILYANHVHQNRTRVIALVRDKKKAERTFSAYSACSELQYLEGDILTPLDIEGPVDYVLHAASVTQSKSFVQAPVETIKTTLWGTDNLLRFAHEHGVTSMVYLSTMEVYGAVSKEGKVSEIDFGYIDPFQVRSSYPESKQAAETLCCAYHSEYGVPVKTARLTLTFGPGIFPEDNRVFAQFCASVRRGEDIVLHTPGDTQRDYLYTADAITALLIILLCGQSGQAYNVANSDTYISIRAMAELVAKECAQDTINVVIKVPEHLENLGYAPTVKINLDTQKLNTLGWHPKTNLQDMYKNLLAYMDEKSS